MFDTFASLITVAPRRSALQTCLALLLVVLLSCCAEVLAEDYPTPAFPVFPAQASNQPDAVAGQPGAARVSPIPFEFNGPSTLESLIEFVSQQLDLGILYGDEIKGESITIRQATGAMDKAALRPFLESVLRSNLRTR